jgi:hypothetical protein
MKADKPEWATLLTIGIYIGTALLALGIAAWTMGLWRADLTIPMHLGRFGGDSLFYDMVVKNLVENGRYNSNPFLGAPGQGDLHDFPLPHFIHYFFIWLISLFSKNFALVLNVYFLLTFPLSAVVSLFVFRRFRISYPSAILGSLLFAFLPYHFLRGADQLFFSSYYLVPLMVLVALWLCTGEPLFWFERAAGNSARGWVTPQGAISLASCVLVASDNPYYAFFGAFFLVIAGIAARFRYRHARAILSSAVLLTVLLLTFFFELSPNLVYVFQHKRNYEVAHRQPQESEFYGMKIAQLILPVTGHRIPLLARVKDYYNDRAPMVNGNDVASLGFIGSIGFLILILRLIFGNLENSMIRLLDTLSILNVSGVLFATIGGFSSPFAFLVSSQIRNPNRMSVFIGFLALFAVILFLERLRQVWARQIWARPGRDGVLFGLFVASLLVLGVFDQTSPAFTPNYRKLKAEYDSDADFVKRIEASLPQNAMVFQLPYVAFPEPRPVNGVLDYDHLRGYLHSRNLRWSYGAIKGREDDLWEKNVAARPINDLAETLVFAGFSGIYVDRLGYSDQGVQLERELANALNMKPIVSTNQRLSFFDLAKLNAKLREKYTAQEWQLKQDAILYPLLVDWRHGFYQLEGTPEQDWRWCSSRGDLYIFNLSAFEKKIVLEMAVSTGYPEPSHVHIESPWFSKDVEVNEAGRLISAMATVSPGRHIVRIVSDARRVGAPGDGRTLVFRVNNFRLKELN